MVVNKGKFWGVFKPFVSAITIFFVLFGSGFVVGQEITSRQCNTFIISEYLENPELSHCFGEQTNSDWNLSKSLNFSNIPIIHGS